MFASGASSDYSVLKWTNWKESLSSYSHTQKHGIRLHDILKKILCGSERALMQNGKWCRYHLLIFTSFLNMRHTVKWHTIYLKLKHFFKKYKKIQTLCNI